jgi:hypothetical protein
MRPITKVDDTYAHPCGCVGQGEPGHIVEACGNLGCPHYPARRADLPALALVVKVRGR